MYKFLIKGIDVFKIAKKMSGKFLEQQKKRLPFK
jgi:hypothetical protein